MSIIVLGGCVSTAPGDREAFRAYRAHRVAAWVITKQTHVLVGFAETRVIPGQKVTLKPARDYSLVVALGMPRKEELNNFRRQWFETGVVVTVSHYTGSVCDWQSLTEEAFHIECGVGEPFYSISLLAPVGSLRSAKLAARLAEKCRGDLDELEDLILAATEDGFVEAAKAAELYGVLGKTNRRGQWIALLNGSDAGLAEVAAAALARLGDAEGTARFCKLCLMSKGNRQTDLVELIREMPKSDLMLETAVRLFLTDRKYLTEVLPGWGCADMDRRYGLLDFLLEYPPEKIKPKGAALLQWTRTHDQLWMQQRIKAYLNKKE